MSKFSSLIVLINSLRKSEKKKISVLQGLSQKDTDYIYLYQLISKYSLNSEDEIRDEYAKKCPNSSLNTSVNYLFDNLLSTLSQLRINQDSSFRLFDLLMKVKVLFEKSIYNECFQLLTKVRTEAEKFENFHILLMAQKLELDYLLILDFPNITEQELLIKQLKINDTIKKIRKINEHSSLYELLKYRILHKGVMRSKKHKQELSDLVVSEMSIVSSSNFENFEIQKNHKLFQSYYLTNAGDYKSALSSFYELNSTFEQNMHLLSNPPIYYLMTIEGVLDNLRAIKSYEPMNYFIAQLENINTDSYHFKIQLKCVVFLYKLFPFLDIGHFDEAKDLINKYKEKLYAKTNVLIPARQAQLFLNTALVYIGTNEFVKARKCISQIMMSDRDVFALPLFRTIRLVNLMILYEMKEFDLIESEVRSIKREIQNKERIYQVEFFMLKFISNSIDGISKREKLILWEKINPELISFRNNKYELQLLKLFDFTAWIECKVKNLPFSVVLKERDA